MSSREKTVRLSAAGFSEWIGVNFQQANGSFATGLGVKLSSGASLTYSVQHTMDNLYKAEADSYSWSAARSTTTGTITRVNHGLSVGDYTFFPGGPAPFNTAYAVASVVDADSFTITVANSGVTAVAWGAYQIHTARVFSHEDLAGETASADGNYAFPPRAIRLLISSYSSGFADLTVIQAGG